MNLLNKTSNSSNNASFVEKIIEFIPKKTFRRYIEYLPFPIERIVETIEYERVEREYLNVPTDEYVVQQSSRLNTTVENKEGVQFRQSVYSPVVLTNFKSNYGVPFQAIYPKFRVIGDCVREERFEKMKGF